MNKTTPTLRQRLLLLPLLAAALSACSTIEVKDSDLFVRSTRPIPDDWWSQAQTLASDKGAKLEQVRFQSADGTALGGLFLRQNGARVTAVYFQGGGNLVQRTYGGLIRQASSLPVNVLFWDYRGMGLSAGQGGTTHLIEDAQAAVREARRLSGESLPVVYWGFSLGTLVSSHLASVQPPDALLLEGTLTTAQDWAENQVPWYARPFVRIKLDDSVKSYDNHNALRALKAPTLMLVGSKDEVSPTSFTRSLEQAMQHRSSCLRVMEVAEVPHGGALYKPEAVQAAQALLEKGAARQGC
ncbi:alpha/beta hydrolase [Pelomonas sp. SE-A7]|uniref:alpha/beta hydrolase n=1 Tax=Pelomonas sp. SE-A7 TaxID=3054953 RepID=UPI00259C88EC|nr:alpha/beta hydrolase [Pelomonas sp. SE-A7]MDM4768396.1 alpha/beta hydrolase [Pelomonas sp. SE-A7]